MLLSERNSDVCCGYVIFTDVTEYVTDIYVLTFKDTTLVT